MPVTLTHTSFKLFKQGCVRSVAQDQAELLLYTGGGAHVGQEEVLRVAGMPHGGTDSQVWADSTMLQAPGKTPLLASLTGML